MNDILGKALLDYQHGERGQLLITETSISEEDELSLPYLFRNYSQMPLLEKVALDMSFGRILDVGCGAGSHSLYLQEKGKQVTAIDISAGAVAVAKLRGVKNMHGCSLLDLSEKKYDTILLLMNGTGIFETTEKLPSYLKHLKKLLNPKGQILIDSSDLQYMYDTTVQGGIIVPATHYYGELTFLLTYKGSTSDWFPWLYLDEAYFKRLASQNGFYFTVVERGSNFDYLAKLTVAEHTPS